MKIYRLTTNQVAADSTVMYSSSVNARITKKEQFFMSMEKASAEADSKFKAAVELLGFQHGYEFRVEEVDVVE